MRRFTSCFLACVLAVSLVLSPLSKVEEAHANALTAAQAAGYALATVLGLYGVNIAVDGFTASDADTLYDDFQQFVLSRTEADIELYTAAFGSNPTALGIQWGTDTAASIFEILKEWGAEGRINLNDLTIAVGSATMPVLLCAYIGAVIENGSIPAGPYTYSQTGIYLDENNLDILFVNQNLFSWWGGGSAALNDNLTFGVPEDFQSVVEALEEYEDFDGWAFALEYPLYDTDTGELLFMDYWVFDSKNGAASLALLPHGTVGSSGNPYVDLLPVDLDQVYQKVYDAYGNVVSHEYVVPDKLEFYWCTPSIYNTSNSGSGYKTYISDYSVLANVINEYGNKLYVNPAKFLQVVDPWQYSVAANFFNSYYFKVAFNGQSIIDNNQIHLENEDVNLGRDFHKDTYAKMGALIGLGSFSGTTASFVGADAVINGDYVANRGSAGVITDWSNVGTWSDVLSTSKAGLAESTLDGTLTLEAEGVATDVATGELVTGTVGSLVGAAAGTSVSNTNLLNGFIAADLQLFFPFCLPWDLYNLVQVFNASAQAPVFSLPLTVPGIVDEDVEIDLSVFDPVMEVARTLELIAFAVGLVFLTKKMIEV